MIQLLPAAGMAEFAPLLALANSRHGAGAHEWPSRLSADESHDHLTNAEEMRGYFRDELVTVPRSPITDRDLRSLRQIRSATWALLGPGSARTDAREMVSLLATARYQLDASGTLLPAARGWAGFAAMLLPLLLELRRLRGRLKVCRNSECGWLYIDRTKNQSRVWCEMASCGNRAKVKRYLARHAPHPLGKVRATRRPASAAAPVR